MPEERRRLGEIAKVRGCTRGKPSTTKGTKVHEGNKHSGARERTATRAGENLQPPRARRYTKESDSLAGAQEENRDTDAMLDPGSGGAEEQVSQETVTVGAHGDEVTRL